MPDEQPTEPMHSMNGHEAVGHLYMQTNELHNAVVHYRRSANGTIEEVDRVSTGGAGSGEFKPTSGQESAPNAFEGAGSVILSPEGHFLFTTNGGDNSVSSFAVGDDGRLTLVDVCATGNPVEAIAHRRLRGVRARRNPQASATRQSTAQRSWTRAQPESAGPSSPTVPGASRRRRRSHASPRRARRGSLHGRR